MRFQRITERGLLTGGLRSGVDHAGGTGRGPRPRWNQSPANQRQVAHGFLWVLTNNGNGLRRCDVVAWTPVFLARDAIEVLFQNLLSPRQSIAPAHERIIPVSGWRTKDEHARIARYGAASRAK